MTLEARERKKIIAGVLKQELEDYFVFTKRFSKKVSSRADYELLFEDGTRLSLSLDYTSGHYPKGCFAAHSSFSVSEGPPAELLKKRLLRNQQEIQMVMGNSSGVIRRFGGYPFLEDTPVDILAKEIAGDIMTIYTGYIHAFVEDYAKALDCIMTNYDLDDAGYPKGLLITNPFTKAVGYMKMLNDFTRLDELIDKAKSNESFYDFHNTRDFQKEILDPIHKT